MESYYRLTQPIPELCAQSGDYLAIDLTDPDFPLQVVRNYDRKALAHLMGSGHLEQAEPVGGPPLVPRASRRERRGQLTRRLALYRGAD